jgi:hypothetical protein
VPGAAHRVGVHFEHDRLAVPRPDPRRRFRVGGKVDVVPVHLAQAALEDRFLRSPRAVPW